MTQKLVTESSEKTQQHVESCQTSPASAQSFQVELHPVAQLQGTLGNRNVAQLIQAQRLTPGGKIIDLQRKLTVGAADDQYEQEANRVARQVLNIPDTVDTASAERAPSLRGAQNYQALQTKEKGSAPISTQTKLGLGGSLQHEEMPEEEELQMKADLGTRVQRQDDGNNAPDAIIPVTVPSVSGTAELTSLDGGNPYFDQAFGKWKYKADGLTTAKFLPPTFTTIHEKASPAKGCDGCDSKDCFKVLATAVITFDVNVNVDLPSGSDFTDLKECEQKQVQMAIDKILKPHEQKHVAAYKTYKGKINKPVSTLACRDDVKSGAALTAAVEAIANAEGSTRSASARAASNKLDPFEVNTDLKECEDKQSVVPSGEQLLPSDVAYA